MSSPHHRRGARHGSRSRSSSTDASAIPPAEGPGRRQARLEHILLQELRALLHDEVRDPSIEGVRLLSIELSLDGGHARLAYVVTAEPSCERERAAKAKSKAGLERATAFLRARLAATLDFKRLPALTFTFIGVSDELKPEFELEFEFEQIASTGGEPWSG